MTYDRQTRNTGSVRTNTGFSVDLAVSTFVEMKDKGSIGKGNKISTADTYRLILREAREELRRNGLDLDGDAEFVSVVLRGWARRRKDGTGDVAENTNNLRLAVLDSFYKFALKHNYFRGDNPVLSLGRHEVRRRNRTKPLDTDILRAQLSAIDRSNLPGMRDYALLLVAFHTGRRVSELASLRWGHLRHDGETVTITWPRVKGGIGTPQDILGGIVREALLRYLHALYGPRLATLAPDDPIWVAMDPWARDEHDISDDGIREMVDRRLGTTHVNVTRTTMGVRLGKREGTGVQQEDDLSLLRVSTELYLSNLR